MSNSAERLIDVTPINRGKTEIHVSVSDSEFVSQQTFAFEVRDVTKMRTIDAEMAVGDMVTLTNELARPVSVRLEHNGFPMFQSQAELRDSFVICRQRLMVSRSNESCGASYVTPSITMFHSITIDGSTIRGPSSVPRLGILRTRSRRVCSGGTSRRL